MQIRLGILAKIPLARCERMKTIISLNKQHALTVYCSKCSKDSATAKCIHGSLFNKNFQYR